jgi:hypothetical protein
MLTVTRIVTGNVTSRTRACPAPPTSTGPVFAEACDDSGEGTFVFLLTRVGLRPFPSRAARAFRPPPTQRSRAAFAQPRCRRPNTSPELDFSRHCPAVTPFDTNGEAIPRLVPRSRPVYDLPSTRIYESQLAPSLAGRFHV